MGLEIKINEKEKKTEVYLDGTLIKVLNEFETKNFIEETKKKILEKEGFFIDDWIQVTKEDIEDNGAELEEVKAINFQIDKYVRCFPEAHCKIEMYKKNGEEINFWDGSFDGFLDENFTPEKLYFGPITNHELRACLSDEIIDYIMDAPGFKINICGMEEDIYKFFDESETRYYESDENFDT